MNTEKQKAIQFFYGKYWEEIKDLPNAIDENGWFCGYYFDRIIGVGDFVDMCEQKHIGTQSYLRPKSLIGIENNNDWIPVNEPQKPILLKDDVSGRSKQLCQWHDWVKHPSHPKIGAMICRNCGTELA